MEGRIINCKSLNLYLRQTALNGMEIMILLDSTTICGTVIYNDVEMNVFLVGKDQ